jgi:hypothetical protein
LIERKHPEIKTPINPTSVSGILRNFAKDGMLKIVTPGVGTRPTIYRVRQLDLIQIVAKDERDKRRAKR